MPKIVTTDKYALNKNIGGLKNVDIDRCGESPDKDDVVLFTGSLRDKTEIAKRNLLGQHGFYITVIPDDLNGDIDPYWEMQSLVMKKSMAEKVLSKENFPAFYDFMAQLSQWAYEDLQAYQQQKSITEVPEISDLFGEPCNNYFYEKRKLRAFRGKKAKTIATEYFLKYNARNKLRALILRVSVINDEISINILSVSNIQTTEELDLFYSESKTLLNEFVLSQNLEDLIVVNGKEYTVQKLDEDIPEKYQLIIMKKDKTATVIFENEENPSIEEIDDFVLLKNLCKNNILLKNNTKMDQYRKFLHHIRIFSDDREFLTDFTKVIQSSRNSFLIRHIKNSANDNMKHIRETLMNFNAYLYENYKKNDSKTTTNLQAMTTILYDLNNDINTVDDRVICNFYLTLRSSVFQNNHSFLKTFDDYISPRKLSLKQLKEIEACIKIHMDESHSSFSDFKEYLHDNNESRAYDRHYLQLLLKLVEKSECDDFSDDIQDVLSRINTTTYDKLYEQQELENDYLDNEEPIGSEDNRKDGYQNDISEEFRNPEQQLISMSLSEDAGNAFTYLDNYMSLSQLQKPESFKCVNEKLLLDLSVMWAVSFERSGANTGTSTFQLIQKCYLRKMKSDYQEEEWLLSVVGIILECAHKTTERDKFRNKIMLFDSDTFLQAFKTGLNGLIGKTIYHFDASFIHIDTAEDKFNKYFVKIALDEENLDDELRLNKNLYKVKILEQLFYPKYGYIMVFMKQCELLEVQHRSVDSFVSLEAIENEASKNVIEALLHINEILFIGWCQARNKKNRYEDVYDIAKRIITV